MVKTLPDNNQDGRNSDIISSGCFEMKRITAGLSYSFRLRGNQRAFHFVFMVNDPAERGAQTGMKTMRKMILIIMAAMMLTACQTGMAETADTEEMPAVPSIEFSSDTISTALIVSDEEIYLCGLYADGSWLKKTNIRNEELSKWDFRKDAGIGRQPVIQCLTTAGDSVIAGLVDSYTQKAAAAVIRDGKVRYYPLPDSEKAGLWSICADFNGLSIISHEDAKSQRTIHYTHVSADGMTESFEVGRSTSDDVVIADSFASAGPDCVYVLRMTKIKGVTANCNRELIAFDHAGCQQWQVLLSPDIVVKGIITDGGDLYLYGMQRLEMNNCALLMRFGSDGSLKWSKTFDDMEQVLRLEVKAETIRLAGQKEDFPKQWVFLSLAKDGTQVSAGGVLLPDAYNTWLGSEDTHINVIENVDDQPCLWQVEYPEN